MILIFGGAAPSVPALTLETMEAKVNYSIPKYQMASIYKGYEALSEKWKEYLYLNDATNTLKAREEYQHNRLIIKRFNLYHYDKPRENRSAALA